MGNFANLKKNRQDKFAKLIEETDKLNSKQFTKDERFWQPTVDKSGSGYAVFRFLPEFDGEPSPYVRLFEHGFKGPTGQWYIENCRTTLGKDVPDPVAELNSQLWNSTEDDNHPNRKQAREQKRKLGFISNIYIISDPAAPENNGTVRLYKYGKKIFDKLTAVMTPEFDDEGRTPENPNYNPTNAFNPFDLWDGATFKLKIRKFEGYRNYDKSEFDDPAPLFDDDDKLEAVYKKILPLAEFIDPKNFKSYDELKARLNLVLGNSTSKNTTTKAAALAEDSDDGETPFTGGRRVAEGRSAPTHNIDTSGPDDEDDDEFFKNLLSE